MGSTRFPGKMLQPLAGRPLLEWVLHRVRSARRLDAVVLATSDLPRDLPLVALAASLGVAAFAGSETIGNAYRHAVAERYRFFSYGDAMLLERQNDAI